MTNVVVKYLFNNLNANSQQNNAAEGKENDAEKEIFLDIEGYFFFYYC